MAYVSVGQVENLEDAIATLNSTYQAFESECQAKLQQVAQKLAECQAEYMLSNGMLAEAVSNEAIKAVKLGEATVKHAQAEAELAAAVATANPVAILAATADVAETFSELQQAYGEYETAKSHRMQMEQRVELVQQALSIATQLEDSTRAECSSRLSNVSSILETGTARLERAKSALNAYLSTNPTAADFYAWLKWSPKSNALVTPAELKARLSLSTEQQRYFIEYLADRDPAFREKIAEYRRELDVSKGPVERHAVLLNIRRNMGGIFSEKIVEYSLSPLAQKVDKQYKVSFESGKFTKIDVIIKDLKVPVILGRGEGLSIPVGGSIAIEVKCGRSEYLYSQKDHMVFQSGGHQDASASMTICSRDIKDLSPEREEELRTALREAGSLIIGILPKKDEIDKVCWEVVLGERKQWR